MIEPAFDAFASGYAKGCGQLLYTRLGGGHGDAGFGIPQTGPFPGTAPPATTPFFWKAFRAEETRGRYSIIGLQPDLIWRCREGAAEINRTALHDAGKIRSRARQTAGLLAGAHARDAPEHTAGLAADGDRPVRLSGL